MPLSAGHKQNFDTSLHQAFWAGDVVLMECQLADGAVEFEPFAMMFQGNPYGRFHSLEENE